MRKVPNTIWKRAENSQNRVSHVAYWRPKKQSLCHTYLLQKPASRLHWLVPKQPNSSRNRAQHAFPAQRPESLTSRTDALKNKAYATPTYCKNQFERVQWLVPKTAKTQAAQTPSGHEPKTAKTQAVALHAKSPKHHLETSRKHPKPSV